MSKSTKGGNVILRDVRAPSEVDPGQTFEVEADISNGALAISPWDADACTDNPGNDAAYSMQVEFSGPGGATREAGPFCLAITELGTNDTTKTATFTAPSTSGTYDVAANVRLDGSGSETGEVSETVTVSGTEAVEPPSNDDGDGGADWGGDDGDGDGPDTPTWGQDGQMLKLAAGGVALLVVLMVLAPYADIGASLAGGGS